MTDNRESSRYVNITEKGEHTKASFAAGEDWIDIVDDFVEQTAFATRSAAMRSLVMMGIKHYAVEDPRSQKDNIEVEEQETPFTPVTIRELIPEGKENAVEVGDELWEDAIKSEILDICYEDPKITVDGLEVYR